jgi:hypothetical protein
MSTPREFHCIIFFAVADPQKLESKSKSPPATPKISKKEISITPHHELPTIGTADY